MSLPSQVGSIFPWTVSHMPGFTAPSRAWASLAARFFWTVTVPVPSVMSKLSRQSPGRRVSRHSKKKTLPVTAACPILMFSSDMGTGRAFTGLPISTFPVFFAVFALETGSGGGGGGAGQTALISARAKP